MQEKQSNKGVSFTFTLVKKPTARKWAFAGARKTAQVKHRKNAQEVWNTVTTAWLKSYRDAEQRQIEDL